MIGWLRRFLKPSSPADHNRREEKKYPDAVDRSKVGTYPALTKSGGGYVWDEVLEYRVWLHPERGATDECDGDDYYYAFACYEDALRFSEESVGAEEPLALVLQKEHIDEPDPGVFEHVTEERITEWRVEWLNRAKRKPSTIPDFFAPNAPENRIAILRGEAE